MADLSCHEYPALMAYDYLEIGFLNPDIPDDLRVIYFRAAGTLLSELYRRGHPETTRTKHYEESLARFILDPHQRELLSISHLLQTPPPRENIESKTF